MAISVKIVPNTKEKHSGYRALGQLIARNSLTFYCAWWTMLAVGVLHSRIPQVPTFSYWEVLIVSVGFRALINGYSNIVTALKDA